MCYCAPFFNHVEKKLDANKQELLDHIDSANEDLKAKITHLEQKTHDQLFTLNQKMKESLALERGDCAERIDRRLFRERKELEEHQENTAKLLQAEMKNLLRQQKEYKELKANGYCNGTNGRAYHLPNGNQPLLRSKSEDLLSETNSNHNSVSLMSSTVTGVSRFTGNSAYHRQYATPTQCGTKPKVNGHNNISRLKMKHLGYPELKRDSRSEGDLTSCHTDRSDHESKLPNLKIRSYPMNRPEYSNSNFNLIQDRWNDNKTANGALWRNTQYNKRLSGNLENKSSGFQSDTSKSQSHYAISRQQFRVNHNHDQNRTYITERSPSDYKSQLRTSANGLPVVARDVVALSNGNGNESSNVLPPTLDNDGSSFV